MGLKLFPGSAGVGVGVEDEARRSRFGSYFPRVFAYVHHRTGDEGTTRELVAETFAHVFFRSDDLKEDEFRLVLFATAREMCDTVRVPPAEGLTERERDLVSLLFDGQLERSEVARLLDVCEETITAELVRALEKLRAGLRTANVPSFLRAS